MGGGGVIFGEGAGGLEEGLDERFGGRERRLSSKLGRERRRSWEMRARKAGYSAPAVAGSTARGVVVVVVVVMGKVFKVIN
jgi:hypothetical protein